MTAAPHMPQFGKAAAGEPVLPIRKMRALYWLTRAETLAKLPKLERGGFHAYGRRWASARRHLPAVDVAKAGGWRDRATMKRSYQQPDPAAVLQAIENARTKGSDGGKSTESRAAGHELDSA